MKFKNLLRIIGLIASLGIILSQTSFAATTPSGSTYTPERPQRFITDGAAGFTYNTYNNYTYDLSDGGQFDERDFAWINVNKVVNTKGDIDFRNTWPTITPKDNDTVILRVNFHNNGEDPYDGSGSSPVAGPSPATKVYVGADFSNANTPLGYIYSASNSYKDSNGQTINYETGDYISTFDTTGTIGSVARTASDTTKLTTSENIELVPTYAKLLMEYDLDDDGTMEPNEQFSNYIQFGDQETKTITIPVATTTLNGIAEGYTKTIPLSITFKIDQTTKQAYFYFNEHPGCFRYAGRAYFYSTVKTTPPPANVCTSLSFINFMDPKSGEVAELTCTAEQKLAWFKLDVNFAQPPEPTTQTIKFLSSDRKATISLPPYNNPDGELIPETGLIKTFSGSDFSTVDNKSSIIGLYNGIGLLSAVYLDENGVEQSDCLNLIIGCSNQCGDICVSAPSKLEAGTYSELSAQTTDYYGDNWNKTITFTVKDPSYGKIYPQVDMNSDGKINELDLFMQVKADHPNDLFIDFVKNPNPVTPCALATTTLAKNKVWFYSEKAGTDVITVSSENDPNCTQKLSVAAPYVPVCQDMGVTVTDLSANPEANLTCMDSIKKLRLDATTFTGTDGQTYTKAEHKLTVEWTTTDTSTTSGFKIDDPTVPSTQYGSKTITSQNQAVIYTGGGTLTATLKAVDGIAVEASPCVWTLPECEKCGDLTLTFPNGAKTAYVGETKSLLLNVTQAGSNAQYPSTVLFKDATGGKIVFPRFTTVTQTPPDAVTGIITYTTIYPYPEGQIYTLESTKAGTIRAEVKGEESVCSDEVSLIENACKYITVRAWLGGTLYQNPTSLNGGEIYKMQSTASFASTTPADTQINYNADNVFTGSPIPFGYFAKETTVDIAGLDITIPNPDMNTWSSDLTVSQTEYVYFFANPQLTPYTYKGAIRVSVVGTEVPGCERSIDLVIPQEDKCTSIVLKTNPTPFDPATKTQITIDPALSIFGDYDGDFTFAITSGQESADLYISENAASGGNSLTISKTQATTTGVYIFATDGRSVTVEVYAADQTEVAAGCKAVLTSAVCHQLTIGYNKDAFIPSLVTSVWVEDNPADLGGYNGDFVFEITEGANAYFYTDTQTNSKKITVPYLEAIDGVGFTGKLETTTIKVYAAGAPDCIGTIKYVYNPEEKCQNLIITNPDSDWEVEDGDDQNFEVEVVPSDHDWILDWTVTGRGELKYTSTTDYTNKVYNVKDGTRVDVSVRGSNNLACKDHRIAHEENESSSSSPKLTKRVAKGPLDDDEDDREKMKWKDDLNLSAASAKNEKISYQVHFKTGKNKGVTSVEIWDDSMESNGEIKAEDKLKMLSTYLGPKIDRGSLDLTELIIEINDKEISGDGDEGEEFICGNKEYDNGPCVTVGKNKEDFEDIKSAFKDREKITFENLKNSTDIEIYYEMKVNTNLTVDSCKYLDPSTGCGEQFINKAKYETNKKNLDGSATTTVTVTCPYILTRAGGDAYFSGDLEAGMDISYCGPQKNIAGPIIKGVTDREKITSTGTSNEKVLTVLSSPTHDVCKFSNTDTNNLSGYQNVLKTFSSSICEMATEITDNGVWNFDNVKTQIIANAERVGRFAKTDTDLITNATHAGVHKYTGGLTVSGVDKTISGAHTYIVYGNLEINTNIKYGTVTSYTDVNNVPSAAFIVIGGNITVGANVEQMDGIYIVIPTTEKPDSGKFKSAESDKQLLINGGLYGDVTELFSNRTYVGDITSDDGSVVIRYSENFIINTPPGLNDLMNISQLKAP